MRNIYLSALSVFMLTGCAIGPDYVKPETKLPEKLRHDVSAQKIAQDEKWWTSMQNHELSAYIEEVLANNLDAKSADAQVNYMLSQFDSARSYLFPQISAGGSLNRQKQSQTLSATYSKSITNTYAASLSVASYELDLWGKIRRANEAARAKLLSSEEARKSLRLSLSTTAALTFIKLQAYSEQEKIAALSAKFALDKLGLAKISHEYGAYSDIDLNDAVTNESNAKSAHLNYKKRLIDAQNQYNQLLGKMPSDVVISSDKFYQISLEPRANISSEVLANRPDIKEAENELVSANAQIGIARAAYFPSISLTGSFGFQSSEFDNLFKGDSRSWQFTPALSVPLFTAGRIGSAVDSAEFSKEKALLAYQNRVITAFSEADSALFNYKNEKEREESSLKSERAMAENLRMSELKYKYGTVSKVTLLSTEQSYNGTKLTYIDAKLSSIGASLDIIKAFGSGW